MRNIALLGAVSLTVVGCGVSKAIDSVNSMPGQMRDMQRSLDKTNANTNVVQEQPVAIAFEGFYKEVFTRTLKPIPAPIIILAKKFAQFIPVEDIPDFYHIELLQLKSETNTSNGYTEPIDQFNHRKSALLMALTSVAGLLPEEKLSQVIDTQIVHSGPRRKDILSLLMMRVRFLRDVVMYNDALKDPITDVGVLEEAIRYADQLERIVRMPFATEISIKIRFDEPEPDVEETLNPTDTMLPIWTKMKENVGRNLKIKEKPLTGDPALDQALLQQEQARMSGLTSLIDERIRGWGGQP